MSAADQLLEAFIDGETIGTSNTECRRFGVNQMPDLVRKLRKKGYLIHRRMHKVYDKEKCIARVARYWMPSHEINRVKRKSEKVA